MGWRLVGTVPPLRPLDQARKENSRVDPQTVPQPRHVPGTRSWWCFSLSELETKKISMVCQCDFVLSCKSQHALSVMRRFTTTVTRMSQATKDEKVALRKRIKAVLGKLEPREIEEQCSSLSTTFRFETLLIEPSTSRY